MTNHGQKISFSNLHQWDTLVAQAVEQLPGEPKVNGKNPPIPLSFLDVNVGKSCTYEIIVKGADI